ncbi:hypothetical protein J6590_032275 [Homalodisca vitripennis]|nr:hypothetical protein J6590_032275 [Homalodisca vitripennis]
MVETDGSEEVDLCYTYTVDRGSGEYCSCVWGVEPYLWLGGEYTAYTGRAQSQLYS